MEDDLMQMIGRRIGDTSDLPDVLRRQLVGSSLDDVEQKIVYTLNKRYQGIANIDEIIVGLYRDHQYVTEDRRQFGGKLYRMQKSGIVESVKGKKGVYRLTGEYASPVAQ